MNDEQYTELNESIDRLSNNTQDTNNAVNDLREYLEEKDQKQEEKAEAEAEETETKEAESNAKTEQDTQTYTELLQSIDEGITVQNGLIAGQFVTDGILCGVLLLTVLWNKLN